MRDVMTEVGRTVRDAVGSFKRTACLCSILIAAGTAAGIYAHLSR